MHFDVVENWNKKAGVCNSAVGLDVRLNVRIKINVDELQIIDSS